MLGMSNDVILSLLRHVLTFIAGLVVAKGWITADMAEQMSGGIVAITTGLFAIFFHAQSNGMIKTLSTMPNAAQTTTVTTTGATNVTS